MTVWMVMLPLVGGYILALKKPAFVGKLPVQGLTNLSLVLLLVTMGAKIGANPEVMNQIINLGGLAIVLTLASVVGSVLLLVLVQLVLPRRLGGGDEPQSAAGGGRWLTLMLLMSVAGGVALGIIVLPQSWLPVLDEASTWVLGLLLLAVGLDLGLSSQVFASLKQMGWRIILVPLAIIVGSIGGALAVCLFEGMAWNEAAAVGSGMGWYSLSSIILSQVHSPLLGAVAFIANIFRELLAIVFTPLLARVLGPIPALGPAGATAMDVMLPVVAKSVGRQYVALAFFSGAALSLSVAVLVNFFMLF